MSLPHFQHYVSVVSGKSATLVFIAAAVIAAQCASGDRDLFVASEAGIGDLDYCRGGSLIAVATTNPCPILNARTYAIENKLKGDITSATCVRCSPDQNELVFVKGKTIEIFNVTTDTTFALRSTRTTNAAVFGKTNTILYTGDESGAVRRWDLTRGKESASQIVYDHVEGVSCLAYTSGGDLLASGSAEEGKRPSSGSVVIWDVSAGKVKNKIKSDFGGGVSAIAFSPSGKRLAIGHWKWDMDSGTTRNTGIVAIWDVKAAKEIAVIEMLDGPVSKLVFVNEDLIAVSVGCQLAVGSVSLINLYGDTIWKRAFNGEAVNCLAISPARDHMVYGTNGGKIGTVSLKPILEKKGKH